MPQFQSSLRNLSGSLSSIGNSGRGKVPSSGAVSVSGAVFGAEVVARQLQAMDPSGLRKERNALLRGMESIVDDVKIKYRANFPGKGNSHGMTRWHYGAGGYPPRGSGAKTVRAGADRKGVYIGAGSRRGRHARRDMRGKELGRGRHPLKAYPAQPRKDWKWYPIPHRPFIAPTAKAKGRQIGARYSTMLNQHARSLGLNARSRSRG